MRRATMFVVIDDNSKRAKKAVDALKKSHQAIGCSIFSCGTLEGLISIFQIAIDEGAKNITFLAEQEMEGANIVELISYVKNHEINKQGVQVYVVAIGGDKTQTRAMFDAGAGFYIHRRDVPSYYREPMSGDA